MSEAKTDIKIGEIQYPGQGVQDWIHKQLHKIHIRAQAGKLISEERWWLGAEHFIRGVFEGGGAKGIVYAGALQALWSRRCWFRAVAGASAGAITASLVAAGIDPNDMHELTRTGLESVQPDRSMFGRMVELRMRTGFIFPFRFHAWLEQILAMQIYLLTGRQNKAPVSFLDLFHATGIELDIVAADISTQRLILFNHQASPSCQVSNAVIASASIPGVFPSAQLAVTDVANSKTWIHSLVDGGVWSNFPMFVFRDSSFRKWQGLDEIRSHELIVGFLLDEEGSHPADPGMVKNASFVPPFYPLHSPAEFKLSLDGGKHKEDEVAGKEPGLSRKMPSTVVAPLFLVGRVIEYLIELAGPRLDAWFFWLQWKQRGLNLKPEWWPVWGPARIPPPRRPFLRWLLERTDLSLRFFSSFLGVICTILLALLMLSQSVYFVYSRLQFDYSKVVALFKGFPDLTFWSNVLFLAKSGEKLGHDLVFLVVFLVVPLYLFTGLLLFLVVNTVALPTLRRSGYGLVTTFLAGPGAPPWAGASRGDYVIRLTIPRNVTTLSFQLPDAQVDSLIEQARAEAQSQLDSILASHGQA